MNKSNDINSQYNTLEDIAKIIKIQLFWKKKIYNTHIQNYNKNIHFAEIYEYDENQNISESQKITENKLGKFILLSQPINSPTIKTKKLIYADNSIYIGQMNIKSNLKEGIGTYYSPSKDKYIGQFKNDTYNGIGRIIYPDGSYYEGEFINGKQNGFGKYENEGYIYIGKWKQEYKSGKGEEQFKDGTYFKGNFYKDYKIGYGILSYQNGKQFEGFFNTEKYGQNITGLFKVCYYNIENEISLGSIINGILNGNNIYTWENGDIYIGEYYNGIQQGFGLFIFDSYIYYGTWINGKQHGYGILMENNNDKKIYIVGEWRHGMEINQFSNETEIYDCILNEIKDKTNELKSFFNLNFSILDIYKINYNYIKEYKFN